MRFETHQFQLQEMNKLYVAEASELGIPPGMMSQHVILGGMDFMYYSTDLDASGEDITGWRFKPTMSTVQKSPTFAGWQVLIIND